MPHLRVSLLGSFQATLDGKPVTGFLSNKVRALLAYLMVEGDRPHSRDSLAGLLWPESLNQTARGSLRAALANLRKLIQDQQTDPPFLDINVHTIGFNPESDHWLDLGVFQDLSTCHITEEDRDSYQSIVNRLEQAVKLCYGGFMEGFYLENCPEFDEWMLVKREQLKKNLSETLYTAIQIFERLGDFRSAKLYAQRQLELEPWDEQAHQRIMYFLALSGRRTSALAQYETCRRILAEDLNVEPSPETIQLLDQIMEGKLQAFSTIDGSERDSVFDLNSNREEASITQFPAFLKNNEIGEEEHQAFFSRKKEMIILNAHLKETLKGNGRIVFIKGEAGSGKTALATEFSHQAMQRNPKLIAATGRCNAFTGIGDPCQPFKNILEMLSGDIESGWEARTISKDHATRLWSLMPLTANSILEAGPNMIDSFVSGYNLMERLRIADPHSSGLHTTLTEIRNNRFASAFPQQVALFDEFTAILQIVSQQHPLILLLDDLQWIDRSSASLLFHLGRYLPGNRILIIGAFRSEEIIRDTGDEEHPLNPLIHELTRHFRDAVIDLDQADGRGFLDDLLSSLPIQLDQLTCDELYHLTRGHPLFALELISDMLMRGDLLQSEGDFHWEKMPDRIDAVIAKRIQRLPEICQKILTAASVEGEEFTADVVAQALGLSTHQTIQYLSGPLRKIHRLVEARGHLYLGGHSLSQYRFRHNLFQRYLYQCLDPVERSNLHLAIGNALEHFHNVEKIEANTNWKTTVIRLAKHFEIAGRDEKAVGYLLIAADLARELQSHHEAIDYLQRALQRQKIRKNYEGAARTLIKLGLTHHTIFEFDQANKALEEGNLLYQYANKAAPVNRSSTSHTLRIDWEALSTFDPALSYDVASAEVSNQLFSGLLLLNFDGDLVPEVASSWDVLDDGHRYLFKLREGLHWSDGTPVTALDFEYAWKRVLDPITASPCASLFYCIQGAVEYNQGVFGTSDQVGIRTINSELLQVDLAIPTSFFPYLLSHPAFKPVPRHVVEKNGERWITPNIIQSNGPFQLEDWEEGRVARFKRNPYYRGDFPGNLDRVELHIVPDWQDRLRMYAADELDVQDLTWFPPREAEQLRLTHAGGYISKPYLFTGYIGFDVSRPPFDDARVRRAFGLAIDKDILADVVGRGHLPPAKGGFVPPGIPGHVDGIGLPYNPKKAHRLLTESGYPNGHGFPSLRFVIPQGAIIVDLEFVRSQWQKNLGLTFDFEILDFLTMVQRLSTSPPKLYAFSYVADYPDPDSFLRSPFCLPATRWQNPVFDFLVNEAVKVTNNDERMNLYQQAETILTEESPLLPLVYGRQHLLLKPWVKRFPTSTSRFVHWKDVIVLRD